jgi:hypothetical protein
MLPIRLLTCFLAVLILSIAVNETRAQQRTVGMLRHDSESFAGYTLFAPVRTSTVYLIDNDGRLVRSWACNAQPGQSVNLCESGRLLHTAMLPLPANPVFGAGGAGGRVQLYDWEGPLVWDYTYSSPTFLQHHDAIILPSGNVLLVAWEYKSTAEAYAAGRNPARLIEGALWPDHLVEVRPSGPTGGDIVWEWHTWDHLVQEFDSTKANYGSIAAHPELVNVNFTEGPAIADWMHTNSVAYNPALDQVIVSIHALGEVWVIDHSTTMAEAKGHGGGRWGRGGDLLYRWGNPQSYRTGPATDKKLFGQHDAQWVLPGLPGAGNMLVFNNGAGRPQGRYSTVDEIAPPFDSVAGYGRLPGKPFGPAAQSWIYTADPLTSFFSQMISGVQRLPNGNTLVCNGANGIFFEVTTDKRVVWEYVNPVTKQGILTQGDAVPGGDNDKANQVFKIRRYAPDFPGFAGRDLTPGDVIERKPTSADRPEKGVDSPNIRLAISPNPVSDYSVVSWETGSGGRVELKVFDRLGRAVLTVSDGYLSAGPHTEMLHAGALPPGVYYAVLSTPDGVAAKPFVVR